jgi:PAS domain S-box-containing protein
MTKLILKIRNFSRINQASGKQNLSFKFTFLVFFLCGLIIFIALAFLLQANSVKTEILKISNQEVIQTSAATEGISQKLNTVGSDLMILAHSPAMEDFLNAGQARDRDRLERLFLVMATEKKVYSKIRYLNTKGMEVIRVNSTTHGAEAVHGNSLQNKRGRYFFKETLLLPKDILYVSPFDLNFENGKIEIPYNPMIRFGTALYDKQGRIKGIVLINYSGQALLDNFKRDMANQDHAMLINDAGYWLKGIGTTTPEWGFMLENNHIFAQQFPHEWQEITTKENGNLQTSKGMFTFNTIYPQLANQFSSKIKKPFTKAEIISKKSDRYWKVVSWVPSSELPNQEVFVKKWGWFYLLNLMLLTILSIYLARLSVGRKQLLQNLRENERRLRDITDLMPVALFVKDAESRFVMMNKACEEQLGISFDDLRDTDASQFFPPDQMAHFLATDAAVFAKGETVDIVETVLNARLKENRLIRTLKKPLFDQSGAPSYLICLSFDITELQKNEARLLESQRVAKIGDWEWHSETKEIFWSREVYRIYGRDSNLPPIPFEEDHKYYSAESWLRLCAAIEKAFKENQAFECDAELILRNGTKLWVVTRGEPALDAIGNVIGLRGTIQDITERKNMDIRINEMLMERINTTLTDIKNIQFAMDQHSIVAITDAQGKITYVNDKFCSISKYSREQLIGQDHRLINSGYHSKEFMHELWRSIANGKVWKGEICNLAKDGSLFWVNTTIVPYYLSEGKPYQYVVIRTDITETKNLELKIQNQNIALQLAIEAAQKANSMKSEFIATMSHEIRTPLTGTIGMLELLSLSSLNAEQRVTLDIAWNSSQGLLRIVSDILDWTKIEEGMLELAPCPTSIRQLLQEVINTFSGTANAKLLKLSLNISEQLSQAYIVDPLRLSQVLNNFASNAIKFTTQGEITLIVELLDRLETGDRIRFSVKDTGIGIAKEAQQHLFQRYTQESRDTARMFGGTGLGLSICRRLAEMMDGQVELISEQGKGSVFSITLTLPVSDSRVEVIHNYQFNSKRQEIKPLLNNKVDAPVILIVDDHPSNRLLLEQQLKMLGFRVESAENGKVALKMWQEGQFTLVISDCYMPEMDGYEFSQAIRKIEADKKLSKTPIIALTANAFVDNKEYCSNSGMDEILIKPVNLTQLKMVLEKWLTISGDITDDSPVPLPETNIEQDTGPIDFKVLKQVVPDEAKIKLVLKDFLTHIHADFSTLIMELEKGEQIDVVQAAHRMHGSCRMVGAKEMAIACANIEQAARNGDMVEARTIRTILDKEIVRLELFLLNL